MKPQTDRSGQSLRFKAYSLLDPKDKQTLASNTVNLVIIAMVFISIITMAMETEVALAAKYASLFSMLELVSVLFFSAEYLVRYWSVLEGDRYVKRVDYLISTESLLDLAAVLPFFIGYLCGLDLRLFIVLRLFRLFKLVRYFAPLSVMATVLRAEARAFASAMLVMLVLVFATATGIYFFEHQVQPEALGSIPKAMWWATVTLTTLGYGDVVPITTAGRIFAAIMTVFAVGIVALPAGMLAARFSEELHKRKSEFRRLAMSLDSDDTDASNDQIQLDKARQRLCLSETDAEQLWLECTENNNKNSNGKQPAQQCPQCGFKP